MAVTSSCALPVLYPGRRPVHYAVTIAPSPPGSRCVYSPSSIRNNMDVSSIHLGLMYFLSITYFVTISSAVHTKQKCFWC